MLRKILRKSPKTVGFHTLTNRKLAGFYLVSVWILFSFYQIPRGFWLDSGKIQDYSPRFYRIPGKTRLGIPPSFGRILVDSWHKKCSFYASSRTTNSALLYRPSSEKVEFSTKQIITFISDIYRVGSKEWPPYSAGKSAFFEVYLTLWDIITPNKPILVKNEL